MYFSGGISHSLGYWRSVNRVRPPHVWSVMETENQTAVQTRGRKMQQLGKVITPANARPGSRPHSPLNYDLAEAWHGFKCGNLRGRGLVWGGLRETSQEWWGWSQETKHPNQSWGKYFLLRKGCSSSPERAGRLPAWVIWKQILQKKKKCYRGSQEGWSGHDRRRRAIQDQVGLSSSNSHDSWSFLLLPNSLQTSLVWA